MNLAPIVLFAAVIINLHQCQEIEIGYPKNSEGTTTGAEAVCAPQQDCDFICYPYSGTRVCSPPYTMVGCFCQIPQGNCPNTAPLEICRDAPPDCNTFCTTNNYTQSAVCYGGNEFEQCTCFCK